MCVTSLLDKILRSYSSVEVKIPIDQADALPFQDRIKKPLGINEFRGDAPSHIDSPARRKAFLRISEIVARTESEDHRKDRCQEEKSTSGVVCPQMWTNYPRGHFCSSKKEIRGFSAPDLSVYYYFTILAIAEVY